MILHLSLLESAIVLLCIRLDKLLRKDCCLQSHCRTSACALKTLPCITYSSKHYRLNLPEGLCGGLLSVWPWLGSWPAPERSLSRNLNELGTELWPHTAALRWARRWAAGMRGSPQHTCTSAWQRLPSPYTWHPLLGEFSNNLILRKLLLAWSAEEVWEGVTFFWLKSWYLFWGW